MQIVVTFNDFEEMEAFAQKVLEKKQPLTAKELNESAKKTEAIINAAEAKEEAEKKAKKEEAKKSSPKTEKPAEEIPFSEDKKEAPAADVGETEVKVLLSKKLKAGKKAEVKELFGKYGVEKLSELVEKHPEQLGAFYKEAEEI